jgi:hypothetical protein
MLLLKYNAWFPEGKSFLQIIDLLGFDYEKIFFFLAALGKFSTCATIVFTLMGASCLESHYL